MEDFGLDFIYKTCVMFTWIHPADTLIQWSRAVWGTQCTVSFLSPAAPHSDERSLIIFFFFSFEQRNESLREKHFWWKFFFVFFKEKNVWREKHSDEKKWEKNEFWREIKKILERKKMKKKILKRKSFL